MARKKKTAVISHVATDQALRLEFLKRNPEFLADVQKYNKMPRQSRADLANRAQECNALQAKWELQDHLWSITEDEDLKRVPVRLPVKVLKMGRPSLAEKWRAKRDGKVFTEDELAGRLVTVQVDTSYPLDDLVALVEKALRDVNRAKHITQHRRRSDKEKFQLRVYDLAREGKTFSEIGGKLDCKESTVKSAFFVATQKIFGARLGKKGERQQQLRNFDLRAHAAKCRTCEDASKFDQLCQEARLYAEQDTKSQRELIGYDTTGEIYRKHH